MAYDASFLTGSDTRPVDPISTGYHHNDQEVADLNNEHIVINLEDRKLVNALEGYEMALEVGNELHRSAKRGERLDQQSYSILKASLKRIVRSTNIGFDELPTMESLDAPTQRELTIVMENVVTDAIKNIWEKIKSVFISMHNKIKTWFIKAFDGAGRLLKQAEALKAKADGMSTATMRNNTFEMSGAKFLNINGKVANPQELAQGIETITNIGEALLGKNAESYNKMFTQIESVLKMTVEAAKAMKDSNATPPKEGETANTSLAEAFNGSVAADGSGSSTATTASGSSVPTNNNINRLLSDLFGGYMALAKAAGIEIANSKELKDARWDNEKVFGYRNPKDLLGGIMLVASFPVGGVDTIESYADFKAGFKISPEPIVNPPKEIADQGTFTTAPTNLVINICEHTITACRTMMNYKLLFEARDKNTGNLMKQMEQYVNTNSNLKGVGQKHIQNSIQTTVAIIKKQQDGETRWAKYAFSVLNKAIVYCRQSLAQY